MAATAAERYAALLPPSWQTVVAHWLAEDAPSFDYGGYVVGPKQDVAFLWGKAPGVLAGRPFVDEIFRQLACTVEWLVDEGEAFVPVAKIAIVRGAAHHLLLGERVALNLLARASGIAARARRLQAMKERAGWHGVVAGTRKTTPGFRLVEKYAMLVGGVDTHRVDLSSMIMLKDNHVWSTGSIAGAVAKAKTVGGFALKIEVEVRSEAEAEEAITAGADIVMLDNFAPGAMAQTAAALKARHPHVLIEGSGGITEDNLATYFAPHIDVLSLGSLSQSVPHVDFSLKIQQQQKAA